MPTVVNSAGVRFGVLPGRVGSGPLTATIMLKAAFRMEPDAPLVQLPEDDHPHLDTDQPWDGDPSRGLRTPSDFALFKPGTDLVMAGHCHSPGGRPIPYTQVSFGVGSFRKTAVVFGDRILQRGVLGPSLSEPIPFSVMPLDWSRAWGGPGFVANPVGRGATDVVLADGTKTRLLPNVESLDRLVGPELRDVEPTGFGPIDPARPQRMRHVGSYDANWVKDRWPWYPDNFDWTYFSSAPPDQYLAGIYLRGDEPLEFINLDPVTPVFRATLPGLQARAFVRVRRASKLEFREVPLRIDTLVADMDARQLLLTWRGVTPVDSVKLKEVEDYFFVLEPGRAPLGSGIADYEALFLKRLEEMRAEFKVPPVVLDAPPVPAIAVPSTDWVKGLRELAESIRAEAAKSAPPAPPPVGPLGIRYPAAPRPPEAPVPLTIPAINAQIKADWAKMDANDPGFADKYPPPDFSDLDADIAEIEAFTGLPPEEPRPDETVWDRDGVVRHAAEGGHFDRQDLSGLDLSGLDLSGVHFLAADLSGADLTGARLLRSDLSESDLTEAKLDRADLSEARLDDADLTGVAAEAARFTGSSMIRASFDGGRLSGANLDEVTATGASFSGCDCDRASFQRARLQQADFTESGLGGVDFRGANMTAADLDGAEAEGSNFEGALATNLRASRTILKGVRFRGAVADRAVFEEADLSDGDFRQARLRWATLTGARAGRAVFALTDLRQAQLDDLSAPAATFVGVDLFRSTLERADLTGAAFDDCNLYEVEFFEAVLEKTSFRDVNVKGTRLER